MAKETRGPVRAEPRLFCYPTLHTYCVSYHLFHSSRIWRQRVESAVVSPGVRPCRAACYLDDTALRG